MNTPAHLILNALALGRGSWQTSWFPITAGALMPDLPMVAFYAYQRGILGTPEASIWSEVYFRPEWQLLFDSFNSLPLLGLAAGIAWWLRAPRALAFLASMILHCLADLPLHHDDAHAHFLPLSSWRFESPISYWDPRHYGHWVAILEILFVLAGTGALLLRSPVRAWRVVAALTLACHALFIGYAALVWLAPDGV